MRRELKILITASSLFMLAGGLFGPIYAIFVEEIGGDLLAAGIGESLFALSAGTLIFFISRWEDRVKHQERLIVVAYAFAAAGFLGYLFVKTPVHLFMVQIVFGIGEAIGSPAFDSFYSRHLDKGKFSSEWGVWEALSWIVVAIAAAWGAFLTSIYGFRSLFLLMFLFSLIGLAISFTLVFGKSRIGKLRRKPRIKRVT